LIERKDIEVWLVPITATRVVVPFRLVIPTPFGQGVLQAVQFTSTASSAQKPRASAAGPKTQ
jgi:hypothetical protein